MVPLAKETEDCLEAAGWRPGRRWRRLKSALPHIERYGHTLSAAAIDFLMEFGDLSVARGSARGSMRAEFDPVRAAKGLSRSSIDEYERDIGLPVSVVGVAENGYMTILVADDERVFLAQDDDLQCIGDDRYDALNSLCLGGTYNVERARRHLNSGRFP